MVLPKNLKPLPVPDQEIGLPSGPASSGVPEGFVTESEVKQLLVGPLAVDPHPARYHGHDGGFAGRVELHESPFMRIAAEEEQAPLRREVPAPEEARSSPAPRHRAAPPQPRSRADAGSAGTRRWLGWLFGS